MTPAQALRSATSIAADSIGLAGAKHQIAPARPRRPARHPWQLAGWIRTARTVIYWGDIDAPGLQFANDLRGHGITVSTILMDTATLQLFRHLAADGAGPQRSTLPDLTDAEQELYVYLTEYAATHGKGLLVEQERIPWQHAYQALMTAMNCPRPIRSVTL
jgi:hypothetical protein